MKVEIRLVNLELVFLSEAGCLEELSKLRLAFDSIVTKETNTSLFVLYDLLTSTFLDLFSNSS